MKYKYPYLKFRNQFYPLVPLKICSGKRYVNTFALVDSGASICLFKPEIANHLGIEVEEGEEILLEGISGKISIYLHKVTIQIGIDKFDATVGFSEEYTASFNLIGRKDFFDRFIISFNEKNKKLELLNVK
ncbi:MAG: aspartyl protease family protein [Elusimicrobiota bacterium]